MQQMEREKPGNLFLRHALPSVLIRCRPYFHEELVFSLTGTGVNPRALGRGWVCLSVFGSEDARGEAQRRLGIPVIRIPFSEDPFHVDRRAMEWFEGVL